MDMGEQPTLNDNGTTRINIFRRYSRQLIIIGSLLILVGIFCLGYFWPQPSYINYQPRMYENLIEDATIPIVYPKMIHGDGGVSGGYTFELPWDFHVSFMDDYSGSDMTAGDMANYMYDMDLSYGSGFTIWSDSVTPGESLDPSPEYYTKIDDIESRSVVGSLYKYTGSLPLDDVSTFSPDNVFMSHCYFGADYLLIFPASDRSVRVNMCGDVDKLLDIFSSFRFI